MLNVLAIMGRLTKDPIQTKIGETIITNVDIAVDNPRKEKDGTRGTTFLPVTCFNGTAENVAKHLRKGSKVAIVGSIQQRNFMRKDGSKGSVIEVIADSVEFLDPKPEESKEADSNAITDEPLPFDPKPEEVKEEVKDAPLYDPYTGKPLKPSKK